MLQGLRNPTFKPIHTVFRGHQVTFPARKILWFDTDKEEPLALYRYWKATFGFLYPVVSKEEVKQS